MSGLYIESFGILIDMQFFKKMHGSRMEYREYKQHYREKVKVATVALNEQ